MVRDPRAVPVGVRPFHPRRSEPASPRRTAPSPTPPSATTRSFSGSRRSLRSTGADSNAGSDRAAGAAGETGKRKRQRFVDRRGSFPRLERFIGLGQLEPAQLATLFPAWLRSHPISGAGVGGMAAFRSPDPQALADVAARATTDRAARAALPFLGDALLRFLAEPVDRERAHPHRDAGADDADDCRADARRQPVRSDPGARRAPVPRRLDVLRHRVRACRYAGAAGHHRRRFQTDRSARPPGGDFRRGPRGPHAAWTASPSTASTYGAAVCT